MLLSLDQDSEDRRSYDKARNDVVAQHHAVTLLARLS